MRTYFILNCAYLVRASLTFLYIPLSDLPVAVNKRRSRISAAPTTDRNKLSAEALNRSFTVRPERRFQKTPRLRTLLKFLLFCFRKWF